MSTDFMSTAMCKRNVTFSTSPQTFRL